LGGETARKCAAKEYTMPNIGREHFRNATLAVLVLLLAMLACGNDEASPTRTIESTSPAPSLEEPTAEPTAVSDDFASGGLGLSQEVWEQTHAPNNTDLPGFDNYDNGKYSVIFTDGNVWHLERNFDDNQPTLDEARVEASSLIPEDSQIVETYSPEGMPELIVDLYLSESLRDRFKSDVWIGGKPGNFIVIYGVFDEKVPGIVIGTGNHP